MLCAEARREVCAFLDEELEPGRRREIESHLTACEPCREYITSLDGLERRLREEHRAVRAPESLRARIRVELGRNGHPAARARRRPWHLTGAAAAAAIVLAALGFVAFGPPEAIEGSPHPAVREMVRIHGDLTAGVRTPAMQSSVLSEVREFLGCRCKFQACTHDLAEAGLSLTGADAADMATAPGTTLALTPYVHEDGRRVTHFSVKANCIEVQALPATHRREQGRVVYYLVQADRCTILLIPHGDMLCIFVFAAEAAMETVLVTALAG